MVCPERVRLITEYKEAVRRYSECVARFAEVASVGYNADTALLRELCVNAWNAAEQARLVFARHELNHFCDVDRWVVGPFENPQS